MLFLRIGREFKEVIKIIFVVTNRRLVQDEDFYTVIERVAKNKIDYLILREKDLDYDELISVTKDIKLITDKYNVPLIINGNLEVAEEVQAYGCQLGYETLNNSKEKCLKSKLKIGASVHSVEEAKNAEKIGVDYIIAGHVFETDCKKGLKGRGIGFIKNISNFVKIPVIAIGGINKENVTKVMESGARGIAIMSSAMKKNNVETIKCIKNLINNKS
ncbi:thiamine phosphate synthase [Clostridium botulinum]|uniref:Thiamine monophosphate synthase n=1 Tax=Clostridium botulinum TaxID=1491 RepID=A0A9Q1UXD2_CLOBO|nr:thiamine phosphate synthase [Clostridium botulinum]AEB75359.1 thiamine-phosphate pyrophosphorylase, putative [Clostridium botulinum BKT015925]KEI02345.1 thiamine monophosphate synthase [Clostridium botulinum D str. 16868]KEI03946.1 thiamine monophosphate synthase [Clostridium botulinum C/D str. Sp77]KLU77111.1 thiamine monophosphate synthase [Clostridium botulinum V891]KOA73548.1 thiamine monophosphate synthase [Clostridium botulinum]